MTNRDDIDNSSARSHSSLQVMAERHGRLLLKGVGQHIGGDERISIAIAPDPEPIRSSCRSRSGADRTQAFTAAFSIGLATAATARSSASHR